MSRFFSTGVSPVQFAEAERSNFKSRTTIQSDGVELQLSLMEMDGRFTNEQKLERARKAMTAQAQRKLDMIGKISKALGMDVVVHDYMRGSNGYFGEDGKIHFVLSGHMSVARVAAHELTHQMQSVASEKYTVVRDQLIDDVGQDRFDRLLKRKAAQYGYNMESEQGRLACDEEVIAELCEGMLSDKDRLERFAERHTDTALTLKDRLTKILNAIHATLKDTFGQNQNRISDMITDEKTADKWLDGLDEVLKKVQEKQAQENKSAIQYSVDETGMSAERKAEYDEYIQNALGGPGNNNEIRFTIGKVDARIAKWLERFGKKISSDAVHVIADNDVRHIRNRHGIAKEGQYGVTTGDLQAIPYILKNANEKYFFPKPNGKSGILYVTDGVDTTYYVEEIISEDALTGKQMIKTKKGTVPSAYENIINNKEAFLAPPDNAADAVPEMYVQDARQYDASTDKISQADKSVKGKFLLDEAYRNAVTTGNVQERRNTLAGQNAQTAEDGKVSNSIEDYKKPITEQDVEVLRSIGRKSVNEFTGADLQKAGKWAYKFYQELGTKSPFFRAWFGDWRANDTSTVKAAQIQTLDISNAIMERGTFTVDDTGWTVYAGTVLQGETKHYARGERISEKALSSIKEILSNAILLDTEVSSKSSNKKSKWTAFMHKLYTPITCDGRNYIAKIAIEEFYNEGTQRVQRRAYQLQSIKIEPVGGSYVENSTTTPRSDTGSIRNVSDLYALVKQYDKDFTAAHEVHPALLNADGTPKKWYHSTNADFTTFKQGSGVLGDGIYFSDYAQRLYGKNTKEVYLNVENPINLRALPNGARNVNSSGIETSVISNFFEKFPQYDAIVDSRHGEIVVKSPTQIKSATDNIGTFERNNPDSRYSLDTEQLEKTVRAIDTKALEEGLQSMNAVSNVNSFTMKDPSRFFDAISKGNESLRNELHDIFEKPHSEATGLYARNLEKMQERVKNIAKEAGVISQDGKKFDKAASAAVQNIGEGIAPIACSVEAKVVEADTIFLKATRNDSEILSGNCTLEAQFFEIWKKLVERQSNIKPLTRERLLPEYRRIL